MEYALWNGKRQRASEISKDYAKEKEIRIASGRKELRCCDPNCQYPIVKYCHGEIKSAFFAHINNDHCDYAKFDSENNQVMRTICKRIVENFENKDCQIQTEIKLLPNHYTHLLFTFSNGKSTAIEIGTNRLSASKIESITKQYQDIRLPLQWIVLDNTQVNFRETQTYFMKRYLLNESKNRDLIVVDEDCLNASQYKMYSDSWDLYQESGSLDDLIFENDKITFAGFHERFTKQEDENKKNRAIMIEKQDEVQQKHIEEKREITSISKSKEERRMEILKKIDQENGQTRDSSDCRWVKCKVCGKIDTTDKFISYGGKEIEQNRGICYNCSGEERKSR